jgi:hypothetical protein
MSGRFNVMEEEGFDVKDNEGFEDEGFEDTLAKEDAMAIAKLDAIAEEVKFDALAEEKLIEEDLLERMVMSNFPTATSEDFVMIMASRHDHDEITKGLKQVDFANKSGNGTGGGGTRGTGGSRTFSGNCFGCGAAGIKQTDCPKCKSKNGNVNLDKMIVNGTNMSVPSMF